MNKKQEVNVVFALHFDDVNDPRYKDITAIVSEGSMWKDRAVVYMSALGSRDELVSEIEKLEQK